MVKRALIVSALAVLLAAPALAQRHGWPPYYPRGRTVGYEPVRVSNITGGDIYYIVTSGGDSLYVRGNISTTKDIAQQYVLKSNKNYSVDFGNVYVISPTTANTVAAYQSGIQIYSVLDDATPIWVAHGHGYIMGNHGCAHALVISTGHDKDATDLNSLWYDGTHSYRLIRVSATGDSLFFYGLPYASGTTWLMPTLVNPAPQKMGWLFGGTHHDSITVTSRSTAVTTGYGWPIVKNVVRTMKTSEGSVLGAASSGYTDWIDIKEDFDLVDPSTIDTTNAAWDWSDGDAWMHVTNTYRALPGCTNIRTQYEVKRSLYLKSIGILQVAPMTASSYANQYVYLPKTKPSTAYNWTAPQLLNTSTTSIWFRADSITSVNNPPDRAAFLFKKTAESNYDVAMYHGYAPFGDAAPHKRRVSVGPENCYWRIGYRKSYPSLVDSNSVRVIGTTFDVYAYRQWMDPKAYSSTKTAYWNNSNSSGDDMVYVDYHSAQTNDATVLPERMWGKKVSVVDTLGVYNISTTVPSTGIRISTTPGFSGYGYAVLMLSSSSHLITVMESGGVSGFDNGTVTPSTGIVANGGSQTYTITPSTGFELDSLYVDWVETTPTTSLTLSNITTDHTIEAVFGRAADYYTITTTITQPAEAGCSVSEYSVMVADGDDKTIYFYPAAGYVVSDVLIDDVSVGAEASHAFTNVTADHTVEVIFAAVP